MAGYKLSLMAKSDLRDIYRYGLLEYGEKQADRYFADFFARFDQIAGNPMLYPAVDHIREGYRRGVCGVHSIYYRIDRDTVEIMRLLGRQEASEAFCRGLPGAPRITQTFLKLPGVGRGLSHLREISPL